MEPVTIHLKDRRVLAANANDLLGHGVAAFGVLGAVPGSFPPRTPADTILAAAQVVAGIALLVAIVREVWEIRAEVDRDHGISWVNLFAGPVRRFAARLDEIAALRRDGATLRVELRDGRTRSLRLGFADNRDEVFAALAEHAAARGIPSATPAAPLASGKG